MKINEEIQIYACFLARRVMIKELDQVAKDFESKFGTSIEGLLEGKTPMKKDLYREAPSKSASFNTKYKKQC